MYARKSHKLTAWMMILAGILGAGLRLVLNIYCIDARGLIPPVHPVGIGLGVLTVLAVILAVCQSRSMMPVETYQENFPKAVSRFLGHILAALGILATVLLTTPGIQGRMLLAWKVLGVISVPCLIAAGVLRLLEKQPFFIFHLCPALFLVANTIGQYQLWSSDPQLLNYLFSLLGILSMLFFAFYHSAFDAGFIWRRRLTFFAFATVCLGLISLPGSRSPLLNLGMVFWALMDRPIPAPRRRRRNPITEGEAE